MVTSGVFTAAKRLLTLLTFLLVTSSAFAAHITYDPPAPTANDSVSVIVSETWRDGCVPRNPRVTRVGQRVEIAFTASLPNVGCIQVITPWRAVVPVGMLEAGRYEIVVLVDGQLLERSELVVTSAAPSFSVVPAVVPVSGGPIELVTSLDTPFTTCTPSGCPNVPVRIGDVTVTGRATSSTRLRVDVPAHAKGVVDVVVGEGAAARTARLALRYHDPADVPDPQAFATVLVPLIFNGPGAYGSQWRTDVRLRNTGDVALSPVTYFNMRFCPETPVLADPPLPCRPEIAPSTSAYVFTPDRPRGVLLRLVRGMADQATFSALVRDTSREDISFGAEMPIVREEDFRTGAIYFPNVPLHDSRYRFSLRVYLLNTDREPVTYSLTRPGGTFGGTRSVIATREAIDEAAFAMVDIPAVSAGVDTPTGIQLQSTGVSPIWAFLTITNNQTQQVTIIRPQ